MKTLKLFSLFAATAFSFATVKAQTADEIVSKHIEAIGGTEKLKTINTLVMEGTLSAQGMEIPIKSYGQQNYGSKQEFVVMGMTAYIISRKDSGWNFLPFNGQTAPEPMTAEDLKDRENDLDIQSELLDYKTKGHSIELLGKEDVDGTECFKLKVLYKNGKEATLYFDPATYFIIQRKGIAKANGQEIEVTTKLSNYTKTPEGLVFPMTIESNTLPGPLTFTKVEVNKAIDEATFKPSN